MKASSPGGRADLELLRQGRGYASTPWFTTRESTHCRLFFSLRNDNPPWRWDAMVYPWLQSWLYTFPPFTLHTECVHLMGSVDGCLSDHHRCGGYMVSMVNFHHVLSPECSSQPLLRGTGAKGCSDVAWSRISLAGWTEVWPCIWRALGQPSIWRAALRSLYIFRCGPSILRGLWLVQCLADHPVQPFHLLSLP